jgi:23S rRNA (cytosine1962-C5)-methyltransferase
VAWARRNAELSALADAPIRWIVDDALAFTAREARRGRRYDAIVLDPPSFGHGPRGSTWRLRDDLPALLDACAAVSETGAAVLLTAHTTGIEPEDLADALEAAFGREAKAGELALHARSGALLHVGAWARIMAR